MERVGYLKKPYKNKQKMIACSFTEGIKLPAVLLVFANGTHTFLVNSTPHDADSFSNLVSEIFTLKVNM